MATIKSAAITNGTPIPGFGAGGGNVRCQTATVTVPAASATTDIFQLFYLPPNAKVVGGTLKTADLDTTTNVTLNVGDTGGGADSSGTAIAADADRYFAAFSGQAAAVTTTMAATGVFFKTGTSKVLVQMTLAAGPSTTAGDVTVALYYTCEEPQ